MDRSTTRCSRIPATRRWSSDERGLPTTDEPVARTPYDFTNGTTIGATQLDTAFSDLTRDDDGRARVVVASPDGADHVTVWAGRGFDYLMIYTGDTLEPVLRRRRGIAIEPMTCPPERAADRVRRDPVATGRIVDRKLGIET